MTDQTDDQTRHECDLEVRGRWIGDMNDPQRRFEGEVVACDHAALPQGQVVTVLFDPGPSTLGSDAGRTRQHGSYRLEGRGGAAFTMTTFARTDRPYGSSERQSGSEELWHGRAVEAGG